MFEKELSFFVTNQNRLFEQYPGKVLTIKGDQIVDVFDSPLEAYIAAERSNLLGSVMIQICLPGPEAYTVTIN